MVAEGESLNVTCTDGTSFGNGNFLAILRNMIRDDTIPGVTNGAERTFSIGPVDSSDNGTVFRCTHLGSADQSPTLTVLIQSRKQKLHYKLYNILSYWFYLIIWL